MFDDRLATVLRHRASGEHAARTQFRQLLDLLGTRKHDGDQRLVGAAWLRLGALGEQIPAIERAAMIRETGWRFRNAELAAHLAEDEPEVAAAALSRANLTEDDWEALIPRLPIRARGFLRLRRDLPEKAERLLERLGVADRGLPRPEIEEIAELVEVEVEIEETQVSVPTEDKTEIGALVERIEQYRRTRSDERSASKIADTGPNAPRLPLEDQAVRDTRPLLGFAFATDARGRIEWADPSVAPMVIGMRLLETREIGAPPSAWPLRQAFEERQPISGHHLTLDGAPEISGEWVVEARPRFAEIGGRFYGYAGRFRRPAEPSASIRQSGEADRIRQLLHELRTPVNAVQGFAEVIQQQVFGPAPHEYRAMAATIAGDAARILAGFDELDRLAKLETGALDLEAGSAEFSGIVRRLTGQLQQVLAPRMAGFALDIAHGDPVPVGIGESEAEGLLWRILASLAGAASAGEELELTVSTAEKNAVLEIEIPAQLLSEDDIFSAQLKPAAGGVSAGLFGAGFSLRLARAEAQSAGGDFKRVDDRLVLTLPLLTGDGALLSQDTRTEGGTGTDVG